MSLDYCGRALGTRQRLPGSSPLATFGSTLGHIGQHLPRVYYPWQQSELQWACGTFSGLLLPLAFWCRLASLAAGCVATLASPLYSIPSDDSFYTVFLKSAITSRMGRDYLQFSEITDN